jgi:hypothetical protein
LSKSVIDFLNDYTTDRRGDIGSLIRVEAIQAAGIILKQGSESTSRSAAVQELVGCLCRLASEKLDKVRLQGWLYLQSFWESTELPVALERYSIRIHIYPARTNEIRRYEHFSHVSSQEYFDQLLTLYAVQWLRLPLLQGLATSAVAGTEGLVRASRSALIKFINSHGATQRQAVLVDLLQVLSTILSVNTQDDRYAIPAIEFLAFLIDSYAVTGEELDPIFRNVFVLVQKAHFRSSNIARLEAAVKAYGALARLEPLRNGVLKKMTGFLIHPFPRVCLRQIFFLQWFAN